MKLEVGKYYRTRGGRKARVLATDLKGLYPVAAAIEFPEAEGLCRLKANGSEWGATESPKDLVAEWVDKPTIDRSILPVWANKAVAMDESREWYCYSEAPVEFTAAGLWEAVSGEVCYVPHSHAPKFQGKPEDSLIVFEDEEVAK